jgi:hypothetical protein
MTNVDTVGVMGRTAIAVQPLQVMAPVAVSIAFSSNMALRGGDIVIVHLEGFTCSGTNVDLSEDSRGKYLGVWDATNQKLRFTVLSDVIIKANEMQNVTVVIKAGMQIPSSGLLGSEDSYFIGIEAQEGIIVPSPVTSIPKIGSFLSSSVTFSPVAALSSVEISISLQLNANISKGETIRIILPWFSRGGNIPSINLIQYDNAQSSSSDERFKGRWDEDSRELILVALHVIDMENTISLNISKNNGLKLPSKGWYSTENIRSTLSTNASRCPVIGNSLGNLQAFGLASSEMSFLDTAIPDAVTFINVKISFASIALEGDKFSFFQALLGVQNMGKSILRDFTQVS